MEAQFDWWTQNSVNLWMEEWFCFYRRLIVFGTFLMRVFSEIFWGGQGCWHWFFQKNKIFSLIKNIWIEIDLWTWRNLGLKLLLIFCWLIIISKRRESPGVKGHKKEWERSLISNEVIIKRSRSFFRGIKPWKPFALAVN